MSSAPVATQVGETLDVHGNFATPVTLNHVITFNNLPDLGDFIRAEIITVHLIGQIGLIKYFTRRG